MPHDDSIAGGSGGECVPGSSRRLTDAQRAIAAHYFRYARKLGREMGKNHPHLADEFVSDACLALIECAADEADGAAAPLHATPEAATHFKQRLKGRIVWRIRDTLRHDRPMGYRRDVEGCPTREYPQNFDDVVGDADLPALDASETFERLLSPLSSAQSRVLRSLYRDGLTQAETRRKFGFNSKSSVSEIHSRAIGLLREAR